ncbi:MAG: redoxin domain-containing protein [Bacteroidota bacterium]
MSEKRKAGEGSAQKKKSGKRGWIELAVIVAIASILYITGLHTEVIGTLQRGLLATGIIQPSYVVEPETMRDAGTEFYFAGEDGVTQNLDAYRGKVVFLNVWASWCPPCIAEMPSIESLYEDMQPDDEVAFLLISVDENFEDAKDFINSRDLDLPVYHFRGKDREVFDSDVVPTTYVITPSGKIAMEKKGMAKYDTDNFKEFLDKLKEF